MKGLTPLLRLLRDYIVMKGAMYKPLRYTRCEQLGIVSCLVEDVDDRDLAYESLYRSKESSRKGSSLSEIRQNHIKHDKRMAPNIYGRFLH